MTEYWDIYDIDGNKTGRLHERGVTILPGDYHICVEVWIINENNELLIQKRSPFLKVLPGLWSFTTGCVLSGETSVKACAREVKEELGIDIPENGFEYIFRAKRTDILFDVYAVKTHFDINEISIQTSEVSDFKIVSFDEIRKMIKNGSFYEYPELAELIRHIENKYISEKQFAFPGGAYED